MKESSKYSHIDEEHNKAVEFLKKGCECGCSNKIPFKKFSKLRRDFQSLSKKEQDAVMMGQLLSMDEGEKTTSSRFPKGERTNNRTFYRWNNKVPLCQETYLNMLGINRDYLEDIRKHLLNKGLTTRIHGNTDRMPQWKTKMNIDENIKKELKTFLLNYAEKHGLPDPGRTKRITKAIILLPTHMSYRSVYRDFLDSRKEDDKLKSMKHGIFLKIWHQLTPNIKFMSPRTDLCDTCQQFRNELHSCSNKSEVEKEELKKISSSTKSNTN